MEEQRQTETERAEAACLVEQEQCTDEEKAAASRVEDTNVFVIAMAEETARLELEQAQAAEERARRAAQQADEIQAATASWEAENSEALNNWGH